VIAADREEVETQALQLVRPHAPRRSLPTTPSRGRSTGGSAPLRGCCHSRCCPPPGLQICAPRCHAWRIMDRQLAGVISAAS
jgi:hypothetical protein